MPLPTMSLRADPAHHAIIRQIAAELRRRPDLPDALRDVLQRNTSADTTPSAAPPDVTRYLTQAVVNLEQGHADLQRRVEALERACPATNS